MQHCCRNLPNTLKKNVLDATSRPTHTIEDIKTCLLLWDASIQTIRQLSELYSLSDSFRIVDLMARIELHGFVTVDAFKKVAGRGGWHRSPYIDLFVWVPGSGGKRKQEVVLSDMGVKEFARLSAMFGCLLGGKAYVEVKTKRRLSGERLSLAPFYRDLDVGEQIRVLREYWALPDDKSVRSMARRAIWRKYGLRPWDLVNATRKFGDVVRSGRVI